MATTLTTPPKIPNAPPPLKKNPWMTFLKVLGLGIVTLLILLGVVTGGIFWLWSSNQALVAQVCDGKPSKQFFPLIAWEGPGHRLAILMDEPDNLMVVVIRPTDPKASHPNLSQDLKAQLADFLNRATLDPSVESYISNAVNAGQPLQLSMYGQTIPVLKTSVADGFSAAVGQYRLHAHETKLQAQPVMYFVAINPMGEVESGQVKYFLRAFNNPA